MKTITIILLLVGIVSCTTTSKLIYSDLYTIHNESMDDIRGAITRSQLLLAKDMTLSNSGAVTLERYTQNDETFYMIAVSYQGSNWRFMDEIILKIDGEIITLTDDDPYRNVLYGGAVHEIVRCYLNDDLARVYELSKFERVIY